MYVSTASNIRNINVRERFCKDALVAIIHKMALKHQGYLTHGAGPVFFYIRISE